MRTAILKAVFGTLWLVAQVTQADVTLVHRVSSGGFKGWGASEGTEVQKIQGDKAREEHRGKMSGAVLSKLTSPSDHVTLTLMDKGVIDTLDVPKKTYTEYTMEQFQKQMEEARAKRPTAKPEKPHPPTARISKAELKVKATGASQTINGFPCKEYLLTMLLEIEDLKSHEKATTRLANSIWTTPENAAMKQARQEEIAFARAFARKAGIALSPKDSKQFNAAMVAGMVGADPKELSKELARVSSELKKIEGYPVLTKIEWYIDSPEGAAKPAPKPAADDSRPVDVSHGMGGLLGSMASNYAQKKTSEKVEQKMQEHADKPLISGTSELLAISVDPLPASDFAVPAGFKKLASPRENPAAK